MSLLDRILRRDPDALPHSVHADRALSLLEDGAVLIDVREQSEWRSGHAPRARHIPLATLDGATRRLPQGATIVVMCASGNRSRGAAAQLRAAGFQATSLAGGIGAWRAAGGPVTTR